WRLRSSKSESVGPHNFSVVHTDPVDLLKPDDHLVLLNPSDPIAFEWQCKAVSGNFDFQVAHDKNFQHLVINKETSDCGWKDQKLAEGIYFWRVRFDGGSAHQVPW